MALLKQASTIVLGEDERAYLERLARRRKVARGDAQRGEIVLAAAERLNNCEIAAKVGVTRQLSTDPQFVEKVRDIVGLYIDPPEKAIVVCVDEKSQIQALDRTQPMLSMRPGQIERRTHDYERHGTTTLFAGFIAAAAADTNVKLGSVIGQCMPRHRAQEFRKFLDEIERNVPVGFDIHVVMDNASSHKTRAIRNWFAKRPRWHRHFTPTSSSWLNQVERFFALLADKQIKRGAHTSVKDLIASIRRFIDQQNADPKPLRWPKSADDILLSIKRFCRRTLDVHASSG
jgi:transposase